MNWQLILCLACAVLHAVVVVVTAIASHRAKCAKTASECLSQDVPEIIEKELDSMYKTLADKSANPSAYKQKFSEYVDDYVYNPDTKHLEPLPPKNIQAEIQSYIDCALERALERFLPHDVEKRDDVVDYGEAVEDLASLGNAMAIVEDYREKLNLPDNYSMAQIYGAVSERA